MLRVVLIHWKADEAAERLERMRAAGFEAELFVPGVGNPLKALGERLPAAFVVDLSRLPAQGMAVAQKIRQQKATRAAPLVFAGGAAEKVVRVRSLLADAEYCEWDGIGPAVRRAIENPPAAPVVPGTMDGYSGVPLPKKLGIREESTVALIGAPGGFERKLEPLPEGAVIRRRAGVCDIALLFVERLSELERKFASATQTTRLWIVWPKQTSGVATDVTQNAVRAFGLAAGWVDFKICAVDEKWAGLAFARRAKKAKA